MRVVVTLIKVGSIAVGSQTPWTDWSFLARRTTPTTETKGKRRIGGACRYQ